jgi:uncharacterized protein
MAGTKKGGELAAATNRARHGKDFYAKIGAKGGKKGRTGGFASKVVGTDGLTGAERAKQAGKLGGRISRRRPVAVKPAQATTQADVDLTA